MLLSWFIPPRFAYVPEKSIGSFAGNHNIQFHGMCERSLNARDSFCYFPCTYLLFFSGNDKAWSTNKGNEICLEYLHDTRTVRQPATPGSAQRLRNFPIRTDWDTHVIHAHDPALSRKIVRAFADGLANGRAGTRSAEQLANTGFVDIEVTVVVSLYRQLAPIATLLIEPIANAAVAAGAISDDQARAWLKELQQLDQRGCFIAQASKFVTTARRPA